MEWITLIARGTELDARDEQRAHARTRRGRREEAGRRRARLSLTIPKQRARARRHVRRLSGGEEPADPCTRLVGRAAGGGGRGRSEPPSHTP